MCDYDFKYHSFYNNAHEGKYFDKVTNTKPKQWNENKPPEIISFWRVALKLVITNNSLQFWWLLVIMYVVFHYWHFTEHESNTMIYVYIVRVTHRWNKINILFLWTFTEFMKKWRTIKSIYFFLASNVCSYIKHILKWHYFWRCANNRKTFN